MNKIAIGTIVVGVILLIVGLVQIMSIGDDFEDTLEAGIIYEGADGNITIDQVNPDSESKYYVHLVDVKYVGGGTGGYNEAHGNSTWNLTEADCDKVKAFSIKDNDNNEMFYPKCNYVEDGTEDNYIVVGHLCTTLNGEYTDDEGTKWPIWTGEGCRSGTYTWNTGGEIIMVYDVYFILEGIVGIFSSIFSSAGACCCGVVILIIGIILAFYLQDNQPQTFETSSNHSLTNNKDDGFTSYEKKGWDQQEDYIRKDNEEVAEKSEIAIPDSEEKKRSGEYELPPPPEM